MSESDNEFGYAVIGLILAIIIGKFVYENAVVIGIHPQIAFIISIIVAVIILDYFNKKLKVAIKAILHKRS